MWYTLEHELSFYIQYILSKIGLMTGGHVKCLKVVPHVVCPAIQFVTKIYTSGQRERHSSLLIRILFLLNSEANGHRRGHFCQQHRTRVLH